ncbi:MAG TPA: helix-turn-helix transcriptional regulator [Selenomonadales bacterium]|nr:helix-turn-helix transcriptional regulator [Selenomonadales bacterium]
MIPLIDVGSRIRRLRLERGISAKEVAISLGVSPSFISGIEKNTNKCSLENLDRICTVLGVTLGDFFAEDREELSPELHRLLASAQKLTPEQLESVQRLLETIGKE